MQTKCCSHLENDAIATCWDCGKPICQVCVERQNGLCDNCQKLTLKGLGQPKKKIKIWVTVFLGVLIAFIALVILLITTCAYMLKVKK